MAVAVDLFSVLQLHRVRCVQLKEEHVFPEIFLKETNLVDVFLRFLGLLF